MTVTVMHIAGEKMGPEINGAGTIDDSYGK